MSFDPQKFRPDFPPLSAAKPPVYLDSACVTLRPRSVINACAEYYEKFPGCHLRATHAFSREASARLERARAGAAAFMGAQDPSCVIFLRNTTEAINLVARSVGARGPVLISELEHNSNLLPWLELERSGSSRCGFFRLNEDLSFSLERFAAELKKGAALVSVPHKCHVTGCEYPVREIAALTHKAGALLLVDGAQGAAFGAADVKALGADFYACSAHKALGPSGFGCLYASREAREFLRPMNLGGGTVEDVSGGVYTLSPAPYRFEAGLQDYSGALGLEAAAAYLRSAGPGAAAHAASLNDEATEELLKFKGLRLIGPRAGRANILNFYVEGVDSVELAEMLDRTAGVMVRAGRHCAHSWYNASGTPPSVRASFHLYNTREEAGLFVKTLHSLIKYFYR